MGHICFAQVDGIHLGSWLMATSWSETGVSSFSKETASYGETLAGRRARRSLALVL